MFRVEAATGETERRAWVRGVCVTTYNLQLAEDRPASVALWVTI